MDDLRCDLMELCQQCLLMGMMPRWRQADVTEKLENGNFL